MRVKFVAMFNSLDNNHEVLLDSGNMSAPFLTLVLDGDE
jgi:hypothetical protein